MCSDVSAGIYISMITVNYRPGYHCTELDEQNMPIINPIFIFTLYMDLPYIMTSSYIAYPAILFFNHRDKFGVIWQCSRVRIEVHVCELKRVSLCVSAQAIESIDIPITAQLLHTPLLVTFSLTTANCWYTLNLSPWCKNKMASVACKEIGKQMCTESLWLISMDVQIFWITPQIHRYVILYALISKHA